MNTWSNKGLSGGNRIEDENKVRILKVPDSGFTLFT